MFKRGDIVMVDFNPVKGHEQGNYRPALILNDCLLPSDIKIVVPITSKEKTFPFEVKLDNRTKTQGVILCFQIRTVDLNNRKVKYVESIPNDILEQCVENINKLISKF